MALIYTETADYSHFTNVLLIHDQVNAYTDLVNAVNSSTFPIVYSSNSSKTELLSLLSQHFTTISRIAILFIFPGGDIPPLFLDNEPLFTGDNLEGNARFIIDLINTFQIKNMDFITCYALNYSTYVSYFDTLTSSTGVIVGSSNDKTGSSQYGGNWIMENTNEDIGNVYFTNSVESYPYLLDMGGNSTSTFVITSDGNIWGCGNNDNGQLGVGDFTGRTTLTKMINTTGKKPYKISSSVSATFVLMTDNSVYQLGLSFNTSTLTLLTLPINEKPIDVFMAELSSLILMESGNIFVYGSNASGQLGSATPFFFSTWTQMIMPTNLNGTPSFICFGTNCTFLLTTTGNVYSCGRNDYGQLGRAGSSSSLLPVTIPNNEIPSSIAAGVFHTIILMKSGNVYGIGYNGDGQLGTGDLNDTTSWTIMNNATGKIPLRIYCSNYSSYLFMKDSTIYACGRNSQMYDPLTYDGVNSDGEFGKTSSTENPNLTKLIMPSNKTPSKFVAMHKSNIALMTDKTVYSIGENANGQFGTGSLTNSSSFIPMTLTSDGYSIGTVLGLADQYIIYDDVICFKEDTEIYTIDGYKPIQQLKKGDLIQTALHGYKPIYKISKITIYHPAEKKRIKDQLYKCTPDNYPELIDDLIITGCHCILVSDFTSYEQKEKTMKINGDMYITDNKYRLPACVDERASVYEKPGNYTIYHFALENDNYYENYGIYANGLLVESCSKKNMKYM